MNDHFESFRARIIGRTIDYFRVAGNSLIIYIDTQPGENNGFIIWFEPTWHYAGPQYVLVGSRQLQDEVPKVKDELDQLNNLIGKKVDDLRIDARSNDLMVLLEGDHYIKTFVSDPSDDWIWHIIDKDARLRLHADPFVISLLNQGDECVGD